jgi:DNA polymerase beta
MFAALHYKIYMIHLQDFAKKLKSLVPLEPQQQPNDKMDYKALIIKELSALRMRDSTTPGGHFKVRAYDKVIKQLGASGPIHSMEDVAAIEGIGAKIHDKIEEILSTGGLAAAEKARKDHSIDALEAFNKIHGVGPVKAAELVKKGIKTIEELAANQSALNENQRKGLKYYYDFLERIPREEMEEHERIICGASADAQLVGSYRRGAATSGDIDVIVRVAEGDEATVLKTIVGALVKTGYIIDTLAHGAKKYMGVARLGAGKARRLDIMVTSAAEFPFAIFYFTGSDQFNVAVRKRAQDRGYSLNEHGFTPAVKGIVEEKDIFRALSMKYVDPANRIDETSIVPCRILRIKKLGE